MERPRLGIVKLNKHGWVLIFYFTGINGEYVSNVEIGEDTIAYQDTKCSISEHDVFVNDEQCYIH